MDKPIRLVLLLLLLSSICAFAPAQAPQESIGPTQESAPEVVQAPESAGLTGSWIATVESVLKAGGTETKSERKIWHKGLKERVEEDAEGGVRTILIDAQAGYRTVIEPGSKYAMKYKLPEKGTLFYDQRRSAPMAEALRKQGFEVVGPDEVDQEEILGVPCIVREITAQPTEEMRKANPKAPELMVVRLWEPKEPAGLPEALKLAQVIKDINVSEFVFASLQRDPVMDEALFEVPKEMAVYDYSASAESINERIMKAREEYLKKKQEEESGGGSSGEGGGSGGNSGGGE